MKTTAQVVDEREPWITDGLARTIRENRTKIFLALCGVPIAANQAELFITFAEERLSDYYPQPAPTGGGE